MKSLVRRVSLVGAVLIVASVFAWAAEMEENESTDSPMMGQMQRMVRIKAALEEASGAAEAAGNTVALAKVEEALELIEQNHQGMHQQMTQMMQNNRQQLAKIDDVDRDVQDLEKEAGAMEETSVMKARATNMKQKMHTMKQATESQGKEHGMNCPMCKKTMTQKSDYSVVNSRCPIMGGKIDTDNVPKNLTREFNGKKIGLCCPQCPAEWDQLSEEQKEQKLEAAMQE